MKESKVNHIFNADREVLGRLATKVALLLRGKDSPEFAPNKMVFSGTISVFNTDKLKFTGNKMDDKYYRWHSGHPGGLKERSLKEMMARDSREVFRGAVYGMLPKNKLRSRLINKLKVFKDEINN